MSLFKQRKYNGSIITLNTKIIKTVFGNHLQKQFSILENKKIGKTKKSFLFSILKNKT